ncbi:MAG: hypothetical protein C0613_07270 [Desulfobulbaceae bacterium]|nr:MAG: hypothetical protein C0613_07270 [Desulfobulbaceae bacterium]
MLTLAQLQANRPLLNKIDWQMTPEKAVEMYLEWGTGWVRGHDFVAGRNDESYYFVLFDWEKPYVTLIRRTVEGAEELAKIAVPDELFEAAWRDDGSRPGGSVHRLNHDLKKYLEKILHTPPVDFSIN